MPFSQAAPPRKGGEGDHFGYASLLLVPSSTNLRSLLNLLILAKGFIQGEGKEGYGMSERMHAGTSDSSTTLAYILLIPATEGR